MLDKKSHYDVIVVGAGASGLLASVLLAKRGLRTLLLEQNDKVGKKILVSGNGQCNISNTNPTLERFHSQNPQFVTDVLKGYSPKEIEALFTSFGLPLVEGKEGKLFPANMQAKSVVELLEHEVKSAGVTLNLAEALESVTKKECFRLKTSKSNYTCDALLLATGSAAAPKLGGSLKGQEVAQSLGHSVLPSLPSLVQLITKEHWVKETSGVKVSGKVTLYVNGQEQGSKEGDILFTNYGLSGLAILDISREVSLALHEEEACELSLDLMPRYTKNELVDYLQHYTNPNANKSVSLWLQNFINKKLVKQVLKQAGCSVKYENELNTKTLSQIAFVLKALRVSVLETKGLAYAEVTTGGVNVGEVEAKSMQSKVVSKLYFAGEMLDVDGDRGGFNFYFAWVCALRIAKAV